MGLAEMVAGRSIIFRADNMEVEMSDAMKTREYADWLDGLSVTSKPCPKALKRIANRLRALEAQLAEVAELPAKWRDGALEGLFSGPTAFRECANELTAILAKSNK